MIGTKSPAHHLPAGTILNDKYQIIRSIGEGGFGITYIGHNMVLDKDIAIKEYYPHGYANRSTASDFTVTIVDNTKNSYFDKWKLKFLREARALAKFSNIPGIVNVYDFFEQFGTAYIVMDYLDGITLKNYVEKNGCFDADRLCGLMIPMLKSLDKVHKQGLIHRDISPDNIMMMPDGTLTLYDFGAAREYSDSTQQSFSIMLKPSYAPEEQYRSRGVQGPWTDVYSVCATIYYCVTGRVPDDSLQRVFSDELKAPSDMGIKISPKLEAAILKGLNVKAEDRFRSAMELADALSEEKRHSDPELRKSSSDKDMEYGNVPDKPIFISGMKLCKEFLGNLRTDKGERLTPSHRREIEIGGIKGGVHIFDMYYPDGRVYGVLYVCTTSKNTSPDVPLGYIYKESVSKKAQYTACPQCGATLPSGSKFCGICGNKILQSHIPLDKTVLIDSDERSLSDNNRSGNALTKNAPKAAKGSRINWQRVIVAASIAVVILCGAGTAAVLLMNSSSDNKTDRYITSAAECMAEMDYERATELYENVLEIDPANAGAYLGMAKAYHDSGDDDKAVRILKEGYQVTGDERIARLLSIYSEQ